MYTLQGDHNIKFNHLLQSVSKMTKTQASQVSPSSTMSSEKKNEERKFKNGHGNLTGGANQLNVMWAAVLDTYSDFSSNL